MVGISSEAIGPLKVVRVPFGDPVMDVTTTDDTAANSEAQTVSAPLSAAEEALFAEAVKAAQASKAADDAKRGAAAAAAKAGDVAVAAFTLPDNYVNSLSETATSAAPETAAERAAVEAKLAKVRAQEELMAAGSAAGGMFAQVVANAKNIGQAMGAALEEADAKREAERVEAQAKAAKGKNKKASSWLPGLPVNVKGLYKELDDAIERGDMDKAKEIKNRIDEAR